MKYFNTLGKVAVLSIATAFFFGCATTQNYGSGFSYDDQDHWEFRSGSSQSPIAIAHNHSNLMQERGTIFLDYSSTIINTEDTSYTIQVNTKGKANINGREFELLQFHFHSPSEHTLDDVYYPLEIHFVHRAENGRLGVIGVFFDEGAENVAFEKVLQSIKAGDKNSDVEPFDYMSLLPAEKSYYHYLGSLTTPPLIENVEWYVMKTPITVSREQINRFNKLYDGNNRKLQPINDRPVLYHDYH